MRRRLRKLPRVVPGGRRSAFGRRTWAMLQGPDVMGGSRPSCRWPPRLFAFERPRSARRALRLAFRREAWPPCWPPAFRAGRRHSARVFWRVLTEMRLWLRGLGCLRGLDPEYPLVGSLPFRRLSLTELERRRISVKTRQETPFPLAGGRLAGSIKGRLPSVGSVSARSDPVRGRGLGSAPGASASFARMLGRCPKGTLLQRRRNSLKFGLAQ